MNKVIEEGRPYHVVVMPINDIGVGPCRIEDAEYVEFEVRDCTYTTVGSFTRKSQARAFALKLNYQEELLHGSKDTTSSKNKQDN